MFTHPNSVYITMVCIDVLFHIVIDIYLSFITLTTHLNIIDLHLYRYYFNCSHCIWFWMCCL